jgi:hypothetical protein
MSDYINVMVVWFDKGLQFYRLQPRGATSRNALAEAFKCYFAGLIVFACVMCLVLFLRTETKPDATEFGGLSVFCLLQIVNTACFVFLLTLCLKLLGVRLPLRQVTIVCCYAFGGLLPIVSITTAYFYYSAMRLAILQGNPGLPYLTAAIYSELLQPEVLSVRILVGLLLCLAVAAVIFYGAHIIRLLSRLGDRASPVRVGISLTVAWFLQFLVSYFLRFVFWLLIIKLANPHAATQ